MYRNIRPNIIIIRERIYNILRSRGRYLEHRAVTAAFGFSAADESTEALADRKTDRLAARRSAGYN